MDISKLEKHYKKLGNIIDAVKDDPEISTIERDLLKSYLLKMYDNVVQHETSEPKVVVQPTNEPLQAPIIEKEISSSTLVAKTVNVEPEKAAPIEEITRKEIQEMPQQEAEQKITTESNTHSSEMDDLFTSVEIHELSERLSYAPIDDLQKAFSINDKILTIRELFGGDNHLFNTVIDRLNTFSSYSEAREYLMNGIAKDYSWDNSSKLGKAKVFVKNVQRRYM